MSVTDIGKAQQPIIIVRRAHSDHDDAPHGGVWKIAFADFMTALMCFFLVMWLINAANEQTKAAVASYFNPVKLIDRNASRKGLEDLGGGPRDSGLTADNPVDSAAKLGHGGNAGDESSQTQDSAAAPKRADNSDEHLFANPYAVLSEIATDTGVMQNVSQKGDGGVQDAGPGTGASGGTSYRDPFAPDFWSQQIAEPAAEASAERARIEGDPAQPGDKTAESQVPKVKAVPPAPEIMPEQNVAAKDASQPEKTAGEKSEMAEDAPSPATLKTAADVKQQIAEAFKAGDKLHDGVLVEATDKGVTISITDRLDFGMFQIGSALPNRDLVLAMDKIGRIINGQKGKVVIEGHTDARPFKSANYDNWRLSTARAQSAYYMLVRGGVEERRIVEVSGFADRRPKDAADPLAAVNRRIEIRLETGG